MRPDLQLDIALGDLTEEEIDQITPEESDSQEEEEEQQLNTFNEL